MYNNILEPTKLEPGSNYHLFKEGVIPMWEDVANAKGGKWIYTSPKQKKGKVDQAWLHTVLSLIGENMNDTGDVCGAVMSVRRTQDRIAVWTGKASVKELQLGIGHCFKQSLDLTQSPQLKFQAHADATQSGSSFQNKAYVFIHHFYLNIYLFLYRLYEV